MSHDVIVVGGGPAGMAASTDLAAGGFDVALVDPLGFGGRLVNIDVLRDCPEPLDGMAGWDLAASLGEAAMAAGVTALFGRAERVEPAGSGWRLIADGEDHEAIAVLVATGRRNRPLPGDEDGTLIGRGVSYCAVCDAQLFAGRPVIVVGTDEWAWTEVLALAPLAASVVWLGPAPRAEVPPVRRQALEAFPNVRLLHPSELVAMRVEASTVRAVEVVLGATGQREVIAAGGVFGADAAVPNSELVTRFASCDDAGLVHAEAAFACGGRPGLFAAGEVRHGALRSVPAAMAEGRAAARAIAAHLTGRSNP